MKKLKIDALKELIEERERKEAETKTKKSKGQLEIEAAERWGKVLGVVIMCFLLWGVVKLVSCVSNSLPDSPSGDLTTSQRADYAMRCQEGVKAQANYRSKADFAFWYDIVKNDKGVFVKGSVELMNGFGAMIPHTYVCQFNGQTLMKAVVGKE